MDESGAIRLQKFLAQEGMASRRACEELITEGRVRVNGKPAGLGMKIDPEKDRVTVDGRSVRPEAADYVYLMLNKPRGYVTTTKDEKDRPVVTQLLGDMGRRIYPVGRLDFNSEGLLLFTNDGAFTYRLTHPKNRTEKGYEVTVSKKVSPEQLSRLQKPFTLDGHTTSPAKAVILEAGENKTKLLLTITEGRNRQIRRMCEETGLLIRRLKRVSVGPLFLGDLPLGAWRYLTREEVDSLSKNGRRL